MSIRYDHVTIRISELQTKTVCVGPWETAVIKAMYGDDAEVTGHSNIDRSRPSASDEFVRLGDRYGPKNSDTPLVASVFGSFGPGVQALAKFIAEAPDGTDEPEVLAADSDELTAEEIEFALAQRELNKPKVIATKEPKPPVKHNDDDNVDDLV